jgi:hypothetical protein
VASRTSEAKALLTAAAVRERSHELLEIALADDLAHWRVDLDRLGEVAAFTAGVIRDRYPTLEVPFHARWRHFVFGGRDLWAELEARARWLEPEAGARAAFDLVITSVLLDAGAGGAWTYRDRASGIAAGRSEGLALAGLRLFESGALSAVRADPLRADAETLAHLPANLLAEAFQASDANPLAGLEGRAMLLRHLGARVRARPDLFAAADSPRPGGLYDVMAERARGDRLPAPAILEILLEALGPVWPDRPSLDGVALGDTWRHPQVRREDSTDGLLPLHKLSQWLAYSLIEPLHSAGIAVTEVDGLTGLAEYRNGGLFLDRGVLALRDPADVGRPHDVASPLVVGWRGLTVALLDRLAPLVRAELGVSEEAFPLARVLEGGTWAAGRIAAQALRPDGAPPLKVISDGTVF